MSKRKALPLSEQILDEATTWFVEFNEGEVGQSGREAFIQWLWTSPEHVRAYLQVTAHWEDARFLTKSSVPTVDELVAMARGHTNAKVISIGELRPIVRQEADAPRSALSVESMRGIGTRNFRRFYIAASIIIAMFGGATSYWLEYQRGVYTTQVGEQRSIQLEDGSTVELNARSKIRIAFHEHERDVELIDGQALFQVAKDHSRPFIVRSGNTNVRAVGTQFDVYKHQDGTTVTVTVVEGRVAVLPSSLAVAAQGLDLAAQESKAPQSNAPATSHLPPRSDAIENENAVSLSGMRDADTTAHTGEIFLAAGEQVTISNASVREDTHADVKAATAWLQKKIVFNSAPLSEVVDEFNRYNTRQLVITDSKIAGTKITGVFSSTNPASLLKGLDSLNRFSIREAPDRIEISSK